MGEVMKNCVEMSGVALSEFDYSHTAYNEDFYNLTVGVTRTSGVVDKIKIICSDYVVKICDIKDSYVYLRGDLRTHNINRHLVVGVYASNIDTLETKGLINCNSVTLNGYLCKKSCLRKTPSGRIILDTILAVNRDKSHNDYIPVIFWGAMARQINKVEIGTELNVCGRFQSRYYTKNNEEHTVYEVSAQEVKII